VYVKSKDATTGNNKLIKVEELGIASRTIILHARWQGDYTKLMFDAKLRERKMPV